MKAAKIVVSIILILLMIGYSTLLIVFYLRGDTNSIGQVTFMMFIVIACCLPFVMGVFDKRK